MKEVILLFTGLGYKQFNQADIKIYDNDCLIVDKRTYNNRLKLYLKTNKVYKMIGKSFRNIILYRFYVTKNNSIYTFNLCNKINYSQRTITFLLTDYNYENLKIEKGELTFG